MEIRPTGELSEAGNRPRAGCLMIMATALFACALLFFNGSIVMAVIDALRESDAGWVPEDQVAQFVVLLGPVLLLVVQWWLIDHLRSGLARRGSR